MADTVTTPDGKMHVLVGSTTIESIVLEYAGREAAAYITGLIDGAKEEVEASQDELRSYEGDLEYWRTLVRDWADELKHQISELRGPRQSAALPALKKLQKQMEEAE